jgi:hypothetical protein
MPRPQSLGGALNIATLSFLDALLINAYPTLWTVQRFRTVKIDKKTFKLQIVSQISC